MNYNEMLDYLKSVDLTMSRYERTEWDAFTKKEGLTLNVPFIHITGSNGKGSTAKFLYEIYRAAGYHVALFAKPYIHKPNELIEIDGKTISDDDLLRIFSAKEADIKSAGLSSFEIETYLAFTYINERKPDLAIIECGMGGATDSTNLADAVPLLSIITTISLEHTAFLGTTVSEIALNKGGIIKSKAPVLVGKLPENAETVLREIARKKQSDFFVVDDPHGQHYVDPYFRFDYRPYKDLSILTSASYQILNASLAIEATKILALKFPVGELSLRTGLNAPTLPCRLERHHNIILDGAHNPEAMEALMKCVENLAISKKVHVLFASYRDKNIAIELPMIARESQDIILTTFSAPRARTEEDYFLYEADYPFNPDYRLALNDLVAKYPDDLILVTGSLAFVYLVRDYVKDTMKL
jgi:dihydrofolate synthase/folylpolyglutamate synthase